MDAMRVIAGKPFEREYEAWVIRGIEMYLRARKVPHVIAAVSPFEEETWPGDERMWLESKVIGLQFKRPYCSKTPPVFNKLEWPLSLPKPQQVRLLAHPNIYYALPAFFNRNLSDVALDHTIFWRPEKRCSKVWYNNGKAWLNPNCHMGMRWGKFIEDVLRCEIGNPGESVGEILRASKAASIVSPGDIRQAIYEENLSEYRDDDFSEEDRPWWGFDYPEDPLLYFIEVAL